MEKTVKKFSIAMMFVSFVLMLGVAFGLPASVLADVTNYASNIGETLKLGTSDYEVKTETEGDNAGKRYVEVPAVDTYDGTLAISAKIVGVNNTITVSSADYKLYLADSISNYVVTYTLTSQGGVKTIATVNVNIDVDSYTFDWVENSQQIIPSTLAQGNKIVFPYPFIYNEDGEVINEDETTGLPTWVSGLSAKLTLAGTSVAFTKEPSASATTNYYEFETDEETTTGTYKITYTYAPASSFAINKEFEFILSDSVETAKLTIDGYNSTTGTSSFPTSMALFVETTLPAPVIKNTNTSVDAYTRIKIKCVPSDGSDVKYYGTDESVTESGATVIVTPSLRSFKFTPTIAGEYTITYIVTDFFGTQITEQVTDTNGIKATKTSASGSAYIVDAYDATDAGNMKDAAESETLGTVEYRIPSIVNKGETFSMPAVFAIDKVATFDQLAQNTTRTVKYTDDDGISHTNVYKYNGTGDFAVNANEEFDLTFEYVGNYTITYVVTGNNGETLMTKTFTIKVEDEYVDETTPEVKISSNKNIPTSVNAGSTIEFEVSATDLRTDDESQVADARLQMLVQYQIGSGEWATLTAKDGKYTIDIDKTTANNTVLTIKATAKDDYYEFYNKLDDDRKDDHIGETTKTITIKNITDKTAPKISSDFNITSDWGNGSSLNEFKAGESLTLPSITFEDENASLNVKAIVKCGNTIVKQFAKSSGNATSVTMNNKTFTATLVGTYVVTYEATDISGKKTLKTLTFKVNGEQIPTLTTNFDSSYEYGDEIALDDVLVYLNGEKQEGYTFITEGNVPEGTNAEVLDYIEDEEITESIICQVTKDTGSIVDNILTAGQSGSVTLKYWVVGPTNSDRTTQPIVVTFTTSDTKAPTLNVNGQSESINFSKDEQGNNVTKRINLPKASVYDLSLNDGEDVALTVTAKNSKGTTLDITEYRDEDTDFGTYYGYIETKVDSVITVTYTAVDNMGNTSTATYTIYAGDTNAPILKVTDLQTVMDNAEYNKAVTLDLTKMGITDTDTNIDYDDVTVTVKCGSENVEFTRENNKITFTPNTYDSEYTITFTLKDTAGNSGSATVTKTFTKASEGQTVSTTVLGTVLIIVALVALGVVIFFFAKPTKAKSTVKLADKKDKNDKIQV